VDNTEAFTHLSLCAGYGGIDLGLKRVLPGLRTVAYAEREAFAAANLVSKIEAGKLAPAPVHTDVVTFPYKDFHGLVEILSGGFPCQPFSTAGLKRAREDERHLFPVIAHGINECRPAVIFLENVAGLLRSCNGTSPVINDVLLELKRLGYTSTFGVFSAHEVGAPHERKRVFILAYSDSNTGKAVAHRIFSITSGPSLDGGVWPAKPGEGPGECEVPRLVKASLRTESRVAGSADGHSSRLDGSRVGHIAPEPRNLAQRYRLIGNGVVPAVAALAFKTLSKRFIRSQLIHEY